jgi:hypothetical protein
VSVDGVQRDASDVGPGLFAVELPVALGPRERATIAIACDADLPVRPEGETRLLAWRVERLRLA